MTLDPLEAARAIVSAGDSLGFTSWRRAAGILTRQALEAAVADLWTTVGHPEMNDVPMTKQLLALPYWRPGWQRVGRDVRAAYDGLSATCHASLYEVPPPPAQLLEWCDAVDRLRAKGRTLGRPPCAASTTG